MCKEVLRGFSLRAPQFGFVAAGRFHIFSIVKNLLSSLLSTGEYTCNLFLLLLIFNINIVTCRSIARERVGKHVSWDTKLKDVDFGNQIVAVESTGVSMDMSDKQTFPRISMGYRSGS
jgi:hypothetical protein